MCHLGINNKWSYGQSTNKTEDNYITYNYSGFDRFGHGDDLFSKIMKEC